jgi:hypothetical protein
MKLYDDENIEKKKFEIQVKKYEEEEEEILFFFHNSNSNPIFN